MAERRVGELAATTSLSDKEIANQLNLSARTVKAHLQSIYRKMGWGGFGSRKQLLQWGMAQENRHHHG